MRPTALSSPTMTLLALAVALAPAARSAEPAVAPAFAAVSRAADAVVLVEYVLEKEGRGFGAVGQRAEMAAVGTILTDDGLVALSSSIFPEDEAEQREPARPHSFVVRLRDGRRLKADYVGRDTATALAFVDIESGVGPLPHVELADVAVRVGDPVQLVELLPERYGYQPSIHETIIASVVDAPRRFYDVDAHLQDAGIGTPVVDAEGRVIGLVIVDLLGDAAPGKLSVPLRILGTLSRQKAPGFPMILPSAAILPLVAHPPRDAAGAPSARSWLGVTLQPVTRAMAEYLHLPPPTGAMVTSVRTGSPAEAAGLKVEDIVVEMAGAPVEATTEDALPAFIDRVQRTTPGTSVPLRVWRHGAFQTITALLATAPPTAVQAEEFRSERFGLAAQGLTIDVLLNRDLPEDSEGVIVSEVETAGWAQVGGIERGDIIQGVNRAAVTNLQQLREALEQAEREKASEVVFFVLRDPDTLFIPVKPEW
jgi:serine protease Do